MQIPRCLTSYSKGTKDMEHKEAIATCALAAFALLSVSAFGGDRASELLESHPEECPYSLYLEFSRNGNRTHYQEKLFHTARKSVAA